MADKWIKIKTTDGAGVRYVRASKYQEWKRNHANDVYKHSASGHNSYFKYDRKKGDLKWDFADADEQFKSGGKSNGFLSFFSNLFNKWSGAEMTDSEREAADYNTQVGRENMELEKQMQLDIFNETQSYEAQVRQMQKAGLNTALMYNGGATQSVPSGPSAQPGTASASPSGEFPDVLGLIKTIMGASQLKSENELRASESDRNSAQAKLAESEANKKNVETSILEIDKSWSETRNWLYTQEGLSRIQKNISDAKVNDGRVELMGSEIKLNLSDIRLKESQRLLNEADSVLKGLDAAKARALLPYAVEYMRADILLKNATTQAQISSAESLHANALVNMAEAMIKKGLIQGGYVEKFLEGLDVANIEKYNLALLHVDQGNLAAAQTEAAGAYQKQAEAQAEYTETSEKFIVADKLIGYYSQFLTLATGLVKDAASLGLLL